MVDKVHTYGERDLALKINELIDAIDALEAGGATWAALPDKPAALTAAQAAGTPSIRAIGTTATTAAAGNDARLLAGSAVAQANSVASDVAGLVTDFNALLAKLRTRGILAP